MTTRRDVLIEPEEALAARDLRFVDATWYMDPSRDAARGYLTAHLPGAVFFDIDAVSDRTSDLPHMLPSEEAFAGAAGALGLTEDDEIVVYDQEGMFSSPRAWWTFAVFGAERVRVLNGGLPGWKAAGGRTEHRPAAPAPAAFEARLDEGMLARFADVEGAVRTGAPPILDARPAGRFAGRDPEPRPGLRSGHMPGALNLPAALLTPEGRLLPDAEIVWHLEEAGLAGEDPVITTCGSGVTAATLALALACIGRQARLYDGSWAEWGREGGGAVETASAA